MIFQFKKDLPNVNERKLECNKIRTQCPDKIPIILEKDPKCDIKTLEKTKFLVP